jgi:hypothetical protein
MTTKLRNILPSQALQQVFVLWLLVAFLGIPARAQEIRIRVLNGRNGKPTTNECLNVWVGPLRGAALLAPTNNEGVAVLHLRGNEVTVDHVSPTSCNGNAAVEPKSIPTGVDTITIAGGNYVACQEHGKVVPGEPATPDPVREIMPSYSIKKIVKSGVSAANTCGKFRAEAKPGELVFFVRPPTWLEKLKR